jgi:AmmeMemoRadiSam system protein A
MSDLTKEQQIALLIHARKSIAVMLKLGSETGKSTDNGFTDPVFKEKRGAFVTLHVDGRLRGCIGYITGIKPVPETVAEMAGAAAFRDPRFAPLRPEEYDSIDIEISILTPIKEVEDPLQIKVGRDGLIISRGSHSGLLLPQVPVEQGWNLETFLEHTCYKAGLPGEAWKKPGTKIESFSAQVFGETGLGLR